MLVLAVVVMAVGGVGSTHRLAAFMASMATFPSLSLFSIASVFFYLWDLRLLYLCLILGTDGDRSGEEGK